MKITLAQQLACIRRELSFRKRIFPKQVAAGKMNQIDADREIAAMQAVHDTLMALIQPDDGPRAA